MTLRPLINEMFLSRFVWLLPFYASIITLRLSPVVVVVRVRCRHRALIFTKIFYISSESTKANWTKRVLNHP